MQTLVAISRMLDWPSRFLGRWLPWVVAAVVLLKFSTVSMRYLFSSTSIKLQDSVTYAHATVFMLLVGFAVLRDDHVRVDMFYAGMSARGRALVDLLCALICILPFCAILGWFSWPYVASAWAIREGALFFGGLPYTYLFKTEILAFAILLALQSVAVALRCVAMLGGQKVAVHQSSTESD